MSWSKKYATAANFQAGKEEGEKQVQLDGSQKHQLEIGRGVASTVIDEMRANDPDAEFSVALSGHANPSPGFVGDYLGIQVTRVAPRAPK